MTAPPEATISTGPADGAATGSDTVRPGAAASDPARLGSAQAVAHTAAADAAGIAEAERGGGKRWPRLVALAAFVGLAGFAAWKLPLEKLPAWVEQLGPAAPVVAVLVCTVLLCALVPRTAISLGCGALFGAVGGAAWSLTAALLAATITYAAGRWAGRDLVAAHTGDRLARLDQWLARRGLLAVIVVRLQPIAPFGLVGYAYGTTSVRFRHYLLGTALGGLPSSFSYATIGAAAIAPDSLSWLTFIPAATGIAISAAAALHWRRQTRHTARPAAA
ncbi:TVP38/TMEM64 family protein [Catellatospora methionotrophica]|uniref:TVP38/TMEM64 family protein n=1 Tax=Catellatospora methionotrophica TaxID=121620 RepID=UPI0033CB67C3